VTERCVAALRAADCSADSFSMIAALILVGFLCGWAGGGSVAVEDGVDLDKPVTQGAQTLPWPAHHPVARLLDSASQSNTDGLQQPLVMQFACLRQLQGARAQTAANKQPLFPLLQQLTSPAWMACTPQQAR
jgi:hypothetical protein